MARRAFLDKFNKARRQAVGVSHGSSRKHRPLPSLCCQKLFKFFGRVVVTNEVLSTDVGVSGPHYASSPFV